MVEEQERGVPAPPRWWMEHYRRYERSPNFRRAYHQYRENLRRMANLVGKLIGQSDEDQKTERFQVNLLSENSEDHQINSKNKSNTRVTFIPI